MNTVAFFEDPETERSVTGFISRCNELGSRVRILLSFILGIWVSLPEDIAGIVVSYVYPSALAYVKEILGVVGSRYGIAGNCMGSNNGDELGITEELYRFDAREQLACLCMYAIERLSILRDHTPELPAIEFPTTILAISYVTSPVPVASSVLNSPYPIILIGEDEGNTSELIKCLSVMCHIIVKTIQLEHAPIMSVTALADVSRSDCTLGCILRDTLSLEKSGSPRLRAVERIEWALRTFDTVDDLKSSICRLMDPRVFRDYIRMFVRYHIMYDLCRGDRV